jgi:phosphatidylglycerophosphatase A
MRMLRNQYIKIDMIYNFKSPFAKIIATCGYIGFSKIASGTVASFITAILIYISIHYVSDWLALLLFIFSISIGWWSTIIYLDDTKKSDPKEVVIDEFAGQSLTILLVKYCLDYLHLSSNVTLLFITSLSFVFFRLFDITKIFPISYFDNIDNAFGAIMDDIIAGLMAALVVISVCVFV